jgi:glycosyltransferase involved in cell wall biosynthesis
MASFDIVSSSSIGEGFPNTIGEAMACEVPCVVTNVGDSAAIVGDTGRVVPPGNPGALAKAWEELIDLGAAGREELGRRARARIVENFSLAAVVHRYESLYLDILSPSTGSFR